MGIYLLAGLPGDNVFPVKNPLGLFFDHQFGVHLEQEFLPTDVGHHGHSRNVPKPPGCCPFPIHLSVLRMLDVDRGGRIRQSGAHLTGTTIFSKVQSIWARITFKGD